MEIDWTSLKEVGIAIVAIVVMFLTFKMVIAQWSKSTETQVETNKAQLETASALAKNAESYDKLAAVFEKSHDRELEFQKEVIWMLKDGQAVIKDTNDKVTDLHKIHKKSD